MRLVCGSCQKPFTVKTVGTALLETAGKEHRPYRLWSADVLVCSCGREIIRTADKPIAHDEEAGRQADSLALHKVRIDYDHEFVFGEIV